MPLRGLERVKRNLLNVPVHVREDLATGLVRIGQLTVEAEAKDTLERLNHVVTGNLKRSIHTKIGAVTSREVRIITGTNVAYALKIERLPDGGYLRVSLAKKAGEIRDRVGRLVHDSLRR